MDTLSNTRASSQAEEAGDQEGRNSQTQSRKNTETILPLNFLGRMCFFFFNSKVIQLTSMIKQNQIKKSMMSIRIYISWLPL